MFSLFSQYVACGLTGKASLWWHSLPIDARRSWYEAWNVVGLARVIDGIDAIAKRIDA